ncbi:MAG: SDR family oxidoreductase [Polyangiaceae bacterium]|nr:SDR family oxidoreductase [Polyangiaceae bacterium]
MSLAVVTGASRGIGRATALALAARGVELALLGRPSDALAGTVAAARGQGARAEAIDCELADASSIAAACGDLVGRRGAPAVVVNVAGVIHRGTVAGAPVEQWDAQLAVNLRAPFLVARALLPAMLAAGAGRIVNVGSISSTVACPGAAAYAASKWGLVGFTKSLAAELTDSGVIALVVLPGSVDTEMLVGSGFPPRMTPAEVASTLVHYALDAPPAHNGAVVEMFGV